MSEVEIRRMRELASMLQQSGLDREARVELATLAEKASNVLTDVKMITYRYNLGS